MPPLPPPVVRQHAIVEGRSADDLDALLAEVERVIGDYQAFGGTDIDTVEP